jgi:hypothetical protein
MNIFPPAHQRLYPFDFYLQMRRLYPVAYDEHNNIWWIFRYGDVQRVLGDYMTYSSGPRSSDMTAAPLERQAYYNPIRHIIEPYVA